LLDDASNSASLSPAYELSGILAIFKGPIEDALETLTAFPAVAVFVQFLQNIKQN
jgi:hypothetical protein